MPILEGEKVTKYFGGLGAVIAVDFAIREGEVVGLIGPNGAGKTTLFNLISGATTVTGGAIRYKGEEITRLKPHQICRKGLARTFQSAKLFAGLTVFENTLSASLFGVQRTISVADASREATELLAFVGLSTVAGKQAKDLPIGLRKRLEIARALATKPELLMLDEVMAGLNPTETADAMELIGLIRKRGVTIVMIEHVMKVIMGLCERIVVLDHGVKIAEGTPEEIAVNQTVVEVYLGE